MVVGSDSSSNHPVITVRFRRAVKRGAVLIVVNPKWTELNYYADIWLGRTQDFRSLLDQQGAPYEWHVYPGEHDAAFFDSHVEDDLRFYGANLAIQ